MPDDWKIENLYKNSISSLIKTGVEFFYGNKIYVATADVTSNKITNTNIYVDYKTKPSRANMKPEKNSIWFAKMKNSRKNILVNTSNFSIINNFIFSTGFYGIKCNENSLEYIWSFIASDSFNILKDNYCNGTTMQAINNDGLKKIELLIPSSDILKDFSELTNFIFQKIELNNLENMELTQTRDTLLPKLMSSEIDVSEIKI